MNNCKLVYLTKKVVSKKTKQEVTITEYYLVLSNGNYLRFEPYSYEDKNKVRHSNNREIQLIAVKINSLDDIKELPF